MHRSRASVARGNMVDAAIGTRSNALAPDTQSFASVRPIITIGAAQITAREDLDHLAVRSAGRVAEFRDWVGVHEPAELEELTDPLPPIELQFGRARGEE